MMFAVAAAGLIIPMLMVLARGLIGPTLYDRVLAGNSFGTKTVLLIAVLGFIGGRPDFLDIALLYALVNFIGTIAVLKFFRYRNLGIADSDGIRNGGEITQGSSEKKGRQSDGDHHQYGFLVWSSAGYSSSLREPWAFCGSLISIPGCMPLALLTHSVPSYCSSR